MNQFTKARLQLTVWYVLLDFLILTVLSIGLYYRQISDVRDIVLKQSFGTHVPRTLTSQEQAFIKEQVDTLNERFLLNLLFVNSGILIAIGVCGYFLSDITLSPIMRALKREKEFVANASHELRTPITAIQTASEVALRTTNRTVDDYRSILSQSLDESRRMRKMVDEMLMLSRSEAGAETLNFSKVEVNRLLQGVVDELVPVAAQRGVVIQLKGTANEFTVNGDRNKLKQLFLILLDNAIKYSNTKGVVVVTLTASSRITVSVTDSGMGILKEDQAHIFEKFYRADKMRSKIDGSGLGLSIAHWIAGRHRARIVLDSEVGKGSTFTVIFERQTF